VLLTRSPAVGDELGRRVSRLGGRNSNQVYGNWICFEHGWERRRGVQLGTPWKRWMSTEEAAAAEPGFPYEDRVIEHARNGAIMGVRYVCLPA